jgi:hypothetical protein
MRNDSTIPPLVKTPVIACFSVQLRFFVLEGFKLVLMVTEFGLVVFSLDFELFDLRVWGVGHGVTILGFVEFLGIESPITFYGNRALTVIMNILFRVITSSFIIRKASCSNL